MSGAPTTGREFASWMISSDSHIIEPPDLFFDRLPPEFHTRGPRPRSENNLEMWYTDGYSTGSFQGANPGARFEKRPEELRLGATFEECEDAASDPALYLAESEGDGIWASVIYPTFSMSLYGVPAIDIVDASLRVYNDWIAAFCSEDPARLKGIAVLNVDDPRDAAAELARAHDRGIAGAMITNNPPVDTHYGLPEYDVLWAVAAERHLPISVHVSTDRADPRLGHDGYDAWRANTIKPSSLMNRDRTVRNAIAAIIFAGVFERYPDLRVGSVESELAWIPFFLDQLDFQYTQRCAAGVRTSTGSAIATCCRRRSGTATASPASKRTATGSVCAT